MESKTYILPKGFVLKGRYYVIKLLGQGGFGITYLAKDTIMDQQVCIKELFISGSSTRGERLTVQSQAMGDFSFDDFKNRFIDEAKQLSKFDHPYIVKVTDIFEANNTAYFAMEYAKGDTLKEYVQQKGALNIHEALPIMTKLLRAVEEVHNKGMLHRDIKPDNIILKPNRDIVLIDFGSARAFGEGQTITQTALLTPGYAPLEQYSLKAKRGVFSDIYALGATMYFLLTGQKPFAATDRVTEKMPAPHELNANITSQVSSAIMLAMELKKEDRFQRIDEFRMALVDVSSMAQGEKEPAENDNAEYIAQQKEIIEAQKAKYIEKEKERSKAEKAKNNINSSSFSQSVSALTGFNAGWIRLFLVASCIFPLGFIEARNASVYFEISLCIILGYFLISFIINWRRTGIIVLSLIALAIIVIAIGYFNQH